MVTDTVIKFRPSSSDLRNTYVGTPTQLELFYFSKDRNFPRPSLNVSDDDRKISVV